MDRTRRALRDMARQDPELAARLVLMTLPAAASRITGPVTYDLTVDGFGTRRVSVDGAGVEITSLPDAPAGDAPADGATDFRLATDPRTLGEMAAGASPVRLMLGGRLRIRGKRRRALALRAMGSAPLAIDELVRHGIEVDPDVLYRALPYMIDPEWTSGHRFTVCYEISAVDGGPGGRWFVEARDGQPLQVSSEPPGTRPDAVARLSFDVYRAMLSGELTPSQGMQRQLIAIDGAVYPITLLGRWIDRAQGRDDAELERERRQRKVQAARAGSWGSSANGAAPEGGPGQGDPAHEAEGKRRASGELLSYGQLYALWERQNWRAHELDFSVDKEQWVTTPTEAQGHMRWSLGSFYIGEERVTADLAPFLTAAPSGEVEVFLATQLVDEARHAAFFDRFGAEVIALDSNDLRGRMSELEQMMLPPWHEVFDGALRGVATRLRESPDDIELFVEGISTYHVVIEGVLAMTGQRFILQYMEDHGLYPGFQAGFSLVERDEHRHIAFGVRFLKEMVERDPAFGRIVERTVVDLVPRAAHVFVPPYAGDPREFVSYGYHSSQIYGYAYRALKRRMGVIGLTVPPAEELMPGPIAEPAEARAAGAPA